MRCLVIGCAGILLIGLADLSIGFYTFLHILVTIGTILVVVNEFENELKLGTIVFRLIAIVFNPLIPIHLGDKGLWMPIDLIGAIIFIFRALIYQDKKL